MNTEKRSEYLTRDSLLKLLSDEEVATVSTAETAARLADGEEYVDLEKLTRGVQLARREGVRMGNVLPRRAVREATWNAIVARLPVASRTSPS